MERIEQTWKGGRVHFHSLSEPLLYPDNLRIGVVVGTFAAVPYIHLQLESRRRHFPRVELLVHDDASGQESRLQSLCEQYGADFERNSRRQPHTLGDLSAFLGGLLWAREKGLDLLVKISRRWLCLTD